MIRGSLFGAEREIQRAVRGRYDWRTCIHRDYLLPSVFVGFVRVCLSISRTRKGGGGGAASPWASLECQNRWPKRPTSKTISDKPFKVLCCCKQSRHLKRIYTLSPWIQQSMFENRGYYNFTNRNNITVGSQIFEEFYGVGTFM